MPYSFDSGTSAAFKQVRTKAQMAGIGALSFICDELGSGFARLGLEVHQGHVAKIAEVTR